MKTHLLFIIIFLLAFGKTLLSQESESTFNSNSVNKSLGLGPVITNVLIVNDTCKGPLIKLTVQSSTSCNFKWSDGSFFSSITPKNAGNYNVTITDKDGNSITGGPYEIKDYPLYPYYNNFQVIGECKSQINGQIHFVGARPTDIYYWKHDSNLHSNIADNLAAGIYKVYITDITGTCVTPEKSFEIHDNTPYLKDIKVRGVSPCAKWPDTSGYLLIDLNMYYLNTWGCYDCDDRYISTHDAKGITYSWKLGDADYDINGYIILKPLPQSGFLKFTFTGADGCYSDTTLYIPLLADLKSNIFTTYPDKETHLYIANTVVKGGQAPYTYKWSDGNTQKGRNDLMAGKSYHVTVTDIYGCSSSNNVYVKKLKGENEVNFVNKGDNIEVRKDSEIASETTYTYCL
ncbi:MAG TPA: hypothetical protein VK590_11300, partial [Saprospiraceae bacterium]|nr:hypothetical protein [Saprospiraceae bacterium]